MALINNIENGIKEQVLLGATGTGKTFTIANVIQAAENIFSQVRHLHNTLI